MVKPIAKLMSVSEYLESEQKSAVRREYVGGQVYAMAGASQRHSRIGGNIFGHFLQLARDKNCRVHHESMKFYVDDPGKDDFGQAFYYPDVMVVCEKAMADDYYETEPCILVEVLSLSTASVDLREKYLEYTRVPSLRAYLIVDQNTLFVRHWWRDDEGRWQQQDLTGDGNISLPCLNGEISLPQIYRGVFE